MVVTNGLMSSKRQDWETPPVLFAELDREFAFTLDAASSDENALCAKHYTVEDDGLSQDWTGETVFCNPPYGREVAAWVAKCYSESLKPGTIVVALLAARTDTKWFHDYIYGKAEVRFIRGRLRFSVGGIAGMPAPFPSMVCIWGKCGADAGAGERDAHQRS